MMSSTLSLGMDDEGLLDGLSAADWDLLKQAFPPSPVAPAPIKPDSDPDSGEDLDETRSCSSSSSSFSVEENSDGDDSDGEEYVPYSGEDLDETRSCSSSSSSSSSSSFSVEENSDGDDSDGEEYVPSDQEPRTPEAKKRPRVKAERAHQDVVLVVPPPVPALVKSEPDEDLDEACSPKARKRRPPGRPRHAAALELDLEEVMRIYNKNGQKIAPTAKHFGVHGETIRRRVIPGYIEQRNVQQLINKRRREEADKQ